MSDTTRNILCFGDSNTHGYDSRTMGRFGVDERWTMLLADMLGKEYHILEEGLSGRTAVFDDPLFGGLSGLSVLLPTMMSHEPLDLVVIMLGTNDTKARFGASAANIASGLRRLTRYALAYTDFYRGGKPNVLLIAPPHIDPRYIDTQAAGDMGEGCAEKSQQLAEWLEPAARELGVHFLDAQKIPGVEMAPYDWMHLSLEAHRAFARYLAEYIPTIL